MRKIQKNFIILICAILFAIVLLLAAVFQDKLIYIVSQAWSGISGTEMRIEDSESRVDQENELDVDDSYIMQEENWESKIEDEQSEMSSQMESSSAKEYDSNIQVLPNVEEENDEVSEVSSILAQESELSEESSLIIEESKVTIDKSKLTEFPITPY